METRSCSSVTFQPRAHIYLSAAWRGESWERRGRETHLEAAGEAQRRTCRRLVLIILQQRVERASEDIRERGGEFRRTDRSRDRVERREELKASGIQTTDLRRTSCRASSSSLWVRAHLTDTFTAALLVCKVKTVLNTNHHHHLSEGTEARGFVVDTFVQMWNNLHRIIARPLIGLQLHLPWQHL